MLRPMDVEGIRYAIMLAGSQKGLAELLGVSKTAVNRWVRQGYVPDEWVKEIHLMYGIPRVRLCNPVYLEVIFGDDWKNSLNKLKLVMEV